MEKELKRRINKMMNELQAMKELIDSDALQEKQKEYHIPWYDYQKSKEAGYTIVPNEEYKQLIKQKERDLDIVPELRPTAWAEGYQHGRKDTEEKYSGMMVCSPEEWNEAISDAFKHGMDEGEKQKENPKSADSISSDCVLDAKCEDRWHKVEDSLPDNGREVLAKDKLGNTLLARYDGEGWDVSVYDDEDYRCDNGISKWCEIPFEKPKEQKPNIELIQKSWYMEGYHDCEFGYEPKWVIKTGEGGPRYEENPKYGQMLEAEQKPVEYLDKDKVYAIMKKLVKLAAFSQLIPINSEEYKMIDEITCDVRSLLDYPIEQKPAEWSEDFDKEVENVHKRYPEVSFAKLTRIAYHFSKWANRRKDMEWSKEDEQGFGNTLWAINQAHGIAKDVSAMGTCSSAENWVKKRIKSLRPVSKESLQSWKPSEEQIYSLGTVVKGYNECTVGSVGYNLKELYRQLKELK